ncbi:MAG: PilN domain-containing protein [Candidatus Omnitrophica bacterium]|nr:PilN domain-containing protein [Candidatus Omnitrophota bacterium]
MTKSVITTIEISESHVKLLQVLRKRGRIRLVRHQAKKITDPSFDGIAGLLSSMVDDKVKESHIIGVIPRSQAMIRYFSLPSHSEQELGKMVSLQIGNKTPYAKEDIVFDYSSIAKESNGYSKVLVAIVHKEVAQKYLDIFKKCQITLNSLTLSSSSIVNGFYHWQKAIRKEDLSSSMVVNVDTSDSEICFCSEGKLLLSRNVRFGARDLGGDYQDDFVREVSLTLESYRKENLGLLPNRIVLISSLHESVFLKEKVFEEIRIPVEIIDLYRVFPKTKDCLIPILSEGDYFSSSSSLGAVFRGPQKPFDLLPKNVNAIREMKAQQVMWIQLIGLVFVAGCLAAATFYFNLSQEKSILKKLEEQNLKLKPRVEDVQIKKSRIVDIENYLVSVPSMVDVVHELYRLTPENISYRSLNVDDSDNLIIQGISEERADVNEFQKNLIGAPSFKDVNLQYATQRRVFEGEITDFKITCKIDQDFLQEKQ